MKFINQTDFKHSRAEKTGVLLTNLGTPEAPTQKALKTYLRQFLSDPRIVELPRLLWWLILNLVILNFRPARSAKAYRAIWTEQGSPLMVHTKAQTEKLRRALTQLYGDEIVVEFAMRYGQPAIDSVLDNMMRQGVKRLIVLPLYPQYSASTTGSTFDAIASNFTRRRFLPELRFINHYHDFPPYIDALAQKIERHWQKFGRADKMIFSYHGIPKRYLLNGDPYHCECYKTSRLLAERLGLTSEDYLTCFQSRFGREEWLKPYTDETLKALATQGIKSVQVACPGFSADCLETIEEIAIENRGYFLDSGGQKFQYIAALNSDDEHIAALLELVTRNLSGWTLCDQADTRIKLAAKAGATV